MLKKYKHNIAELKKYSDIKKSHIEKTKYLEEAIERYMEYLANSNPEPSDFTKIKQKIMKVDKGIEAAKQRKSCKHLALIKQHSLTKKTKKMIKSIYSDKWVDVNQDDS